MTPALFAWCSIDAHRTTSLSAFIMSSRRQRCCTIPEEHVGAAVAYAAKACSSHGTPCGFWALRACDVLEVEEVDGGHANLRRRQRCEIRATAAAT